MVGTTMLPTAATVAGPEPETAAKNIQTTTVTMAKPPVTRPRNTLQTFRIRLDTPPAAISSPARMNRGIAISGKESLPLISWLTMKLSVIRGFVVIAAREARPIAIPTGTFNTRKTKRVTNKTMPVIRHTPPHSSGT